MAGRAGDPLPQVTLPGQTRTSLALLRCSGPVSVVEATKQQRPEVSLACSGPENRVEQRSNLNLQEERRLSRLF